MQLKHSTFLKELEKQATLQAKLSTTRLLPARFDVVTTFVGNHPWQVILGLSFITSVVITFI